MVLLVLFCGSKKMKKKTEKRFSVLYCVIIMQNFKCILTLQAPASIVMH